MNLTRTRRLLRLIGLLQAGRGHNISQLAADCQVSRRTIFRDLDVLREVGIPLLYDEEFGAYRIRDPLLLPPTNFTTEEALAILVLCDELGRDRKLPFIEPARSAALKIQAALPARLRDEIQEVTAAIRIHLTPGAPLNGQQATYHSVLEGIRRRRCVRIVYDSLSDRQVIQTRLSPYRLLFSRRAWYVVGRSSLHRGVRTFHIGRIRNLEPTEDRFQLPKGFSLERYLRNAWHLIPDGGDHEVHIRFEPMVARNVAEVQWHKTQRLEFAADGSLDYRVTVSGLAEIAWWILGYGDQAEVVAPPELRQLVAGRLRCASARYSDE